MSRGERLSVTSLMEQTRGGLIVSCQAYEGEPLHRPGVMPLFALSAEIGGARAVRLEGVDNIREGVGLLRVPVIGIVKDPRREMVITATLEEAVGVARAGADVVAVDGTRRERPDGHSLSAVCQALHDEWGVAVMADCGSLEDAVAAAEAGADVLGTTLAGYAGARPRTDGPDLELVHLMSTHCGRPVIAEGRVRTPAEAAAALDAGAHAVCVGGAITHPASLTSQFVRALTTRSASSGARP